MILKGLGGKVRRFVRGRIADSKSDAGSIAGIPSNSLFVYPAKESKTDTLVVFYSGDGGWADLTSHLAKRFSDGGNFVIGIDCMQYFWKEKSPERAASDLVATVREHLAISGCVRIILIGYSMGADVLPWITTQLPEKMLKQVSSLILMSPSPRVELRFRFVGWLGYLTPHHKGRKLLPDLESLSKKLSIHCFAGERENDTLAIDLPGSISSVKLLPGGHHYGHDFERLADEVLSVAAHTC